MLILTYFNTILNTTCLHQEKKFKLDDTLRNRHKWGLPQANGDIWKPV